MTHEAGRPGCVREMSNSSSTFSVDETVAEGGKSGRPDSATDLQLHSTLLL